MSKSLNKVTLIGNLTRQPEIYTKPNGEDMCSFSLAINRDYKDKRGDWQEATDYVDIVAYGKLATMVTANLVEGSRCAVHGRLQTRTWQKDGDTKTKLEVLANEVIFL